MRTVPSLRMPALLQALFFYRWPLELVRWCERRYGPVFSLHVPPFGRFVYLSEPDAIAEVFSHDGVLGHAGEVNQIMEPVIGTDALLLLDRDAHRDERKLLTPAFTPGAVGALEPAIRLATRRELDTWVPGEVRTVRPAMQRITFEVITKAVLGADDPELRRRLVEQLEPVFDVSLTLALPAFHRDLGRFSPWGRFLRARRRLDETIYQIIADRRAGPTREDVLDVLLASVDEQGNGLTDKHIRDEIVTLLLAGHETTAASLSWALELLSQRPDVTRDIRAGDGELLRSAVAEILRVRPVIMDVGRRLSGPVTVAGHDLPTGTTIFPGIYLVHHGERNHSQAAEFEPRRFLDGRPNRRTWLPFGGGRRRCIGAGLAELEMRVVLEEVLARFEPAPASESAKPEKPRLRGITFVPAHDARLRMHAVATVPSVG